MGALNITPDSFSDGGLFFDADKAYEQAKLMINNGAAIIDIGGESTRPGAKNINEKDEWLRVKNTIIKLKKDFPKIVLSLDTRKSYVAKEGIENKIDIINDVSGLNFDQKLFDLINLNKEVCRILKPDGINIYTVRHADDGDYKNGIHRGEDLYENDGFIVHFFSKDKINQLSKGFEILDIEKFEEGKFPRKLFMVTMKKKSLTG